VTNVLENLLPSGTNLKLSILWS